MAIVDEKKIIIDNQELTIRSAQPSDAASLRDFVKQVAVDSKYLLRTTAEEFTLRVDQEKAWVQKALENKSSVIIICLVEDEVVALTDAQGGRRSRNADIAELGTSVAKKWRGKGLVKQ